MCGLTRSTQGAEVPSPTDAFGIPDNITNLKLMEDYEAMVPKYESDPAAGLG